MTWFCSSPYGVCLRLMAGGHLGLLVLVGLTFACRPLCADAPVANDDSFVVATGNSLTVAAPGVLSNDTAAGGGTLTAMLVDEPIHGTLTLNADGGFSYMPSSTYVGTDEFSYQADDGSDYSDPATVTVLITGNEFLFRDDFSRLSEPGPLPPWEVQSGNWTVTGGVLKGGTNAESSYGFAYVTNSWTDYSVEGRIQFSSSNAWGGGIGGRVNPTNGAHYAAWVYPEASRGGSNVLKLVKFQTWLDFGYKGRPDVPMAQAHVGATGTNWHTVKLTFQGNRIKVHYDGILVLQATDAEEQPHGSGGISMGMWTDQLPDNMSVSEVAVRPPVLEIPDPQLEAAIRSALGDPTSSVTNLDLAGLTCLWACNRQITNLDGLEWATNLASLYLNDNAISDLTPVGNLTRLTALEICGNPISSLKPLTGLQNLRCLVLGGHPVTDYSALAGLTKLTFLSLREAGMVSLTYLQNLTRLTSLKLWESRTRDISSVARLTNLTCLDLRWNSITNFASSLTNLTRLTNLYLGGNSISNVTFLKHLKQLTLLNLDDNHISDVSPVTNLTSLNYLAMSRNAKVNLLVLTNVPNLVSLELRGNAISNLNFLSPLSRLSYVDLAYNNIGDLGPLTNLTGLNALVLAGNRITDLAPLRGMPNLTNLWLFDNAISNASFLADFTRLNHLDLDQNKVSDVRSLVALTNLTSLGLSGNPMSEYRDLTNFTKLTSLRLGGSHLGTSELAHFLPALTELRFLDLNRNQLTSLAPLTGLNRLEDIYLRRNRLQDISELTNLPNVLEVDVSLNMLNPTLGSEAMSAIRNLEGRRIGGGRCACGLATNDATGLSCGGIGVTYEPQNLPPRFTSLLRNERPVIQSPQPRWFVPANTNSTLTVSVWEDPPPADDDLVVTAVSLNPNLVAPVTNPLPGTNYSRTLTVAAGNPSDQEAMLELTVTDEVLLSHHTNILVTVVADTNLSTVCPDIDPNLAEGISLASGKPVSDLTLVDLLMLSQLYVHELTNDNPCAWQWLTNLNTLAFSGNSATNVSFLTNVTQLASLVLYSCGPADFSALAGLSNLRSVSVYDGSISDLGFLSNLTQLTSVTLNNVNVTDFSPLGALTNLLNLSLYGQSVSNLTFLSNATQLVSLTLNKTRVADLSPLAGLTNLQYLHLSQNRLENVSALPNLSRLAYADLRWNLLDLAPDAAASTAIRAVSDWGVVVSDWPQREPPVIAMNTNWLLRADGPSWLYFRVVDNAPEGEFSVTSILSDNNAIASTNLTLGQLGEGYYGDYVDWFLKIVPSGDGTADIMLTVTNDAGLAGEAAIRVTVVTPLDVTNAVFPDTDLRAWVTGVEAPWFGQTNISPLDGVAAQSGSLTNHGNSWLQAEVNGPGILTFWWKVSCEPIYNETNYSDFLRFFLDANELARISGEVDWQEQVYSLPPGPHTLLWDYSKDSAESRGMDAGWVSQVGFVPASWLEVVGSPSNGECTLNLWLAPGKTYQVLYSTNWVDWSSLGTVNNADTVTATNQFVDATAETGARFYRLRELLVWLDKPVGLTNGTLLIMHGPEGLKLEVQASTNLTSWIALGVLTNTRGTVQFMDILESPFPMRFYRAVALP